MCPPGVCFITLPLENVCKRFNLPGAFLVHGADGDRKTWGFPPTAIVV